MDKNYIEFFSSAGNSYVFDNNTGQIFCTEKKSSESIIKYHKQKLGQYPSIQVKKVSKEEIHKFIFTNGFKQLQLEVTNGCNLRCKYCCFSECYELTRSHGNQMMSWDVAKMAVDYYFENFKNIIRRNPEREPYVSFYGGEPLLNFTLIKQVVNYISEMYSEYDVNYNITTNATLLDEEISDFFVSKDFSVLVSLDGDEETHNKNRCFENEVGSFEYAFRNLSKFRKRYPEYKKISISACYDVDADFEKIEKFFNEQNLFVAKFSFIDQNNTTFFDKYTDEDWNKFRKRYGEYRKKYILSEEKFRADEFINLSVGVSFLEFSFHLMTGDRRNSITPYSGTCVPGEKLYISVNGDIHMCEKVNPRYSYGNINNGGIDFGKLENIVNEYNNAIGKHCSTCNVSKLCNLCFKAFGTENGFEYKKSLCENFKEHMKTVLVEYVDILEHRPDEFEKVTISYFNELIQVLGRGC